MKLIPKIFFSWIFGKNVNIYSTQVNEHMYAENKHMQKNLSDSENHSTYDLRI